jgi:hypothetical protein
MTSTEGAGVSATQSIRIQESFPNLGLFYRCFPGFSQFFQTNFGTVPRSGTDRLLPNPSQVIILTTT